MDNLEVLRVIVHMGAMYCKISCLVKKSVRGVFDDVSSFGWAWALIDSLVFEGSDPVSGSVSSFSNSEAVGRKRENHSSIMVV